VERVEVDSDEGLVRGVDRGECVAVSVGGSHVGAWVGFVLVGEFGGGLVGELGGGARRQDVQQAALYLFQMVLMIRQCNDPPLSATCQSNH
jgi:hypothetical protein